MAPVEPAFLNSNTAPLAALYTQLAVAGTLLAFICGNISNAHRNVPPSQHTRHQHVVHRRGVIIFASLAFIGLVLSAYFAVARRVLSYKQWAHQSGERVPNTLWSGWYAHGADKGQPLELWQLGRWMADANVWREGDLAAVGSAKAWWWTQQQFAGLLAFSAYVGLEARRREMPAFTIAALIPLASLVGLNVAQNLFFVALLLTPDVPARPKQDQGYDPLWAPGKQLQVLTSLVAAAALFFTPHHPAAVTFIFAQRWLLPSIRAALPVIIPRAFGVTYATASAARRAWYPMFVSLAILAFGMHAKQTLLALSENAPKPTHEHSLLHQLHFYWHDDPSTTDKVLSWVDRFAISSNRVLNVLHSHPAVAATAWDVLLSAASLCVWTAIRGIDATALLKSSLAPWLSAVHESHVYQDAAPSAMESKSVLAVKPAKHTRGPSTTSASSTALNGEPEAAAAPAGIGKDATHRRKPSGRGTTRKAATPAPAADPDPYPDNDEDNLLTTINAANIIAADAADEPAQSTRRATRRKTGGPAGGKGTSSTGRGPTRKSVQDLFEHDEDDDDEGGAEEYRPTPGTAKAVSRVVKAHEHEPEGAEAAGEVTALSWGLFIVGGLGVLGAGISGADGW